MKYEYLFFQPGSTEDTAATISTNEVLPGIQVGHSLHLETGDYSQTLGYHLEIRHVEVYVFAPVENLPPSHVQVKVYTVEKDRKTVQEILKA